MNVKNRFAVGVIVLSLSLAGCSKKQTVSPDDGMAGSGVTDSDIDSGHADSDNGNAMGMQTIHFPFDSFEIVGENREILRSNIRILRDNPNVQVQIEGHCDERGGIQYNLALGEKRANAVRQQLVCRRNRELPDHNYQHGQGEADRLWQRGRSLVKEPPCKFCDHLPLR
jgi:peptidoglycan-associated lipoprotein